MVISNFNNISQYYCFSLPLCVVNYLTMNSVRECCMLKVMKMSWFSKKMLGKVSSTAWENKEDEEEKQDQKEEN